METLQHIDQQLFLYLNNLGSSQWDGFWVMMTNQWMSIPIYVLLALLLWKKTGFKETFISMVVLVAMLVVTYVISHLVKYGVARPRPCNMGFDMRFPLASVGSDCGEFGFFSTHASVGMAMIFYMGYLLKKYYNFIFWPLYIWLAFFCYSRIYVGKHYPGDIIIGLLVGLVLGILFLKLRRWIGERYNTKTLASPH